MKPAKGYTRGIIPRTTLKISSRSSLPVSSVSVVRLGGGGAIERVRKTLQKTVRQMENEGATDKSYTLFSRRVSVTLR